MMPFKFLQNNKTTLNLDWYNTYEPYIPLLRTQLPERQEYQVGEQEPPYGISRRHWNLLPDELRIHPERDILDYLDGWEAGHNNYINNPHHNGGIRARLWNRGFWDNIDRRNGRQPRNYTTNIEPPIPARTTIPTTRTAVIATSLEDFNIWRHEVLRGYDEPHYGAANMCVFGHNLYQAATTINSVQGHMFDGYLLTLRAWDNRDDEIIQEIVAQIQQYCLRTNTNETI